MQTSRFTRFTALAASVPMGGAALAQVTSTWTNRDPRDQNWTTPGNWDHSLPELETWPNNGNEGFNYGVVINGPAGLVLGTTAEINSLTASGFWSIQNGGTLDVLGSTQVQGNGGLIGGGTYNAIGDLNIGSGTFTIDGWTVEANKVNLGTENAGSSIQIKGVASLSIGDSLDIHRHATINSSTQLSALLSSGTIRQLATVDPRGQTTISAELEQTGGAIRCEQGTMLFQRYFGSVPGQPTVRLAGTRLEVNGPGTGDLVAATNQSGTVVFQGPILLELAQAIIDARGGEGEVQIRGSTAELRNATLLGGNFRLADHATLTGFLLSGGGKLRYSAGTLGGECVVGPGAEIIVEPGGDHTVNAVLLNQGTITQQGSIEMASSARISNEGLYALEGFANINSVEGALFLNPGRLVKDGGSSSTCDVSFDNTGVVEATDGDLVFPAGAVKGYDPDTGRLQGGRWLASLNGRILFEGPDVPSKILEGTVVTLSDPESDVPLVGRLSTLEGSLNVRDGQQCESQFSISTKLGSSLTVSDEDENVMTRFRAPEITSEGVLSATGGTIETSVGTLILSAGRACGDDGTYVAAVVNNVGATICPGVSLVPEESSYGCLEFDCDYVQGENAVLEVDIGGTTGCTEYDQVNVTGSATLDGTLSVRLTEGFVPDVRDTFLIWTADAFSGSFANAAADPDGFGELEADGGTFLVRYADDAVELTDFLLAETKPGDLDEDGDVDLDDFRLFAECIGGPEKALDRGCRNADFDDDNDVDEADFAAFTNALTG